MALLFSFNGNTEVNGNTVIDGTAFADFFIGDGSQLTNLPFSYNSNEAGGIEVINYTTASGSNAFAVGNDNSASGSSSIATGREQQVAMIQQLWALTRKQVVIILPL